MLERLTELRTAPVMDGAYEWVAARARYAVDPSDPGTARIADIGLAPRDADGLIRFSGDVVLLRPVGRGNGRALLAVPNRGMVALPFASEFRVGGTRKPFRIVDPHLLDQGWTIAWPGWQWDVPKHLVGLTPPECRVGPGWLRADFRIEAPAREHGLHDILRFGPHQPALVFDAYPAASLDDPGAALRVRTTQMGPGVPIPHDAWSFTSPTTLEVAGGFRPHHWYELDYRSTRAPLVGAGLLAVRDVGAHLRSRHDAVFGYGQSQSGRFLREFLFEGLNVSEDGERVFDGIFAEIASARRGEFNRRYAQPGQLGAMMPEYGPPYDSASLLNRQRRRGGVPKVFFVNSAWEYWRGDAALVHQDPVSGADLPEDPDVRAHLVSGTDHLGASPTKAMMPLGNPPHALDPGPVHKALFRQLQDWSLDGIAPTPSQVPRRADGSAVTREEVLARFPAAARPDPAVLPWTPAIDPDRVEWPLSLGEARVALVSDVDESGNEVAGIRLPAVEAGVAAYTGWNPRRHIDGLPDVLYDMAGSRLPTFTGASPAVGDIRSAADRLVERRLLLPEDAERVVERTVAETRP